MPPSDPSIAASARADDDMVNVDHTDFDLTTVREYANPVVYPTEVQSSMNVAPAARDAISTKLKVCLTIVSIELS